MFEPPLTDNTQIIIRSLEFMIEMTEEAQRRIKGYLERIEDAGAAFRIRVRDSNTGLFHYDFSIEGYEGEASSDITIRIGGFATRLDPVSSRFLKGARIDFQNGVFCVENPNKPVTSRTPETLTQEIIESIKEIFDPEIPNVNIFDLGLIYNVDVGEDGKAAIVMTLTAPNCPAAEQLPAEVEKKAKSVAGITLVDLKLTFEPPWTPERMTEEAKLTLNLM